MEETNRSLIQRDAAKLNFPTPSHSPQALLGSQGSPPPSQAKHAHTCRTVADVFIYQSLKSTCDDKTAVRHAETGAQRRPQVFFNVMRFISQTKQKTHVPNEKKCSPVSVILILLHRLKPVYGVMTLLYTLHTTLDLALAQSHFSFLRLGPWHRVTGTPLQEVTSSATFTLDPTRRPQLLSCSLGKKYTNSSQHSTLGTLGTLGRRHI